MTWQTEKIEVLYLNSFSQAMFIALEALLKFQFVFRQYCDLKQAKSISAVLLTCSLVLSSNGEHKTYFTVHIYYLVRFILNPRESYLQ